jgi:hypothetical protein
MLLLSNLPYESIYARLVAFTSSFVCKKLNSSFICFYSFSSASALFFSSLNAVALSKACFDNSNASCFSVAANSSSLGYFSGTGTGLSSGYSSGN